MMTQDIRGIDRSITKANNLSPVFLLNLQVPVYSPKDKFKYLVFPRARGRTTKQFIFRNFRGASF